MVRDDQFEGASKGRPRVLVVRFHSLGDCVLTTGVTRALATQARVSVLTEARSRPVFDGLPWLERVLVREEIDSREAGPGERHGEPAPDGFPELARGELPDPAPDGFPDLAPGGLPDGTGRRRPPLFDRVFDLQGTLGSRRLSRLLGRERASVRTRSGARRWLVWWGDRAPRPQVPHAVERYARAAGLDAGDPLVACRPEVVVTAREEIEARQLAPDAFVGPSGTAVAIVTGASRRTKEYPPDRFAQVARLLRAEGLATWWIEPPDSGPNPGRAAGETIFRLPLGPLKAVLARARVVAVSDSGPMHLAAALGVPVLGIFGSTVTRFGFAPVGSQVRVLEVEGLTCRPCGVHGRNRCWLGHWRCLGDLGPARVAEELRILAGRSKQREESHVRRGA